MGNYYCQIAALPDIAFDGSKLQYTVDQFKEDIYPSLSADDADFINLVFLVKDNLNIIELLQKGEDAIITECGCFGLDELKEIMQSAMNGDKKPVNVPSYMYDFLLYYYEKEGQEKVLWSDILASRYYSYAAKCKNSFVAEWFVFNRNVNNILVAIAARKYKMNLAEVVVGDDEVAEALRLSAARDFGLVGALDYLEDVQRISDESNLIERERKLDGMRWRWLDDNSVFCYFTVEKLFVFLQKVCIVERWAALDSDKGMQCYNRMIKNLKGAADNYSVKK